MGRLNGHMVYKIISTEFLPLRERSLHDPDEDTYINMLKTLLATGPMYFSYSLDITNSFQRQAQFDPSVPLWRRADDRFFWNRYIQSDLINFRNGSGSLLRQRATEQPGLDPYILPVMFGMMRIVTTRILAKTVLFALITRRSRFKAGTRYFSRGIDQQGHVSNYNETEQICILNDSAEGRTGGPNQYALVKGSDEIQVLSYVQTRGSVPVYWAEINKLRYTPSLEVRGAETAVDAAEKHFREQIGIYGENYLVNLVNQKGREIRIKEAYEEMVRILVTLPAEEKHESARSSEKFHIVEPTKRRMMLDKLHYIYFDFHNETKDLKWHRAELLLEKLRPGLEKGGYFRGVDMPGDVQGGLEVRAQQSAVVRTNCMDCLDRTNVVQSMLGRYTLDKQLLDAGLLPPGQHADDDPGFNDVFRNMWADNADVVSKSYSGTGALKTDFTRTGKRTQLGALMDFSNSITRYVRNNFFDGVRQDGFDLFLGVYEPSSSMGSMVFADRRPLFIQAIPYLLAASFLMVLIATFTRSPPESSIWPVRIFVLVWTAIGSWCFQFIYAHGMLYVCHPIYVSSPTVLTNYLGQLAPAQHAQICD